MSRLRRFDISMDNVRTAAVPAMAIGGLIGIVGVMLSLQCGGLDKCFSGRANLADATIEVAEAAEEAVPEPRLLPDSAPVATVAAPAAKSTAKSAPAVEVAAAQPVVVASKPADVIGGTFAAVASDDEGWLSGELAVPAVEPMEEGDGAGPPEQSVADNGETAAEALAAATREAEVMPLERPKPLQVNAFVEEPAWTDARERAVAQQKLDAAKKAAPATTETKVASALAVDPAPVAKKATTVATKKVASVSGDTRTVGGSGVTVRSGPGKSNGRLFALSAGEKVKVSDNKNGWLKITDDKGRTGWAYKSYLR